MDVKELESWKNYLRKRNHEIIQIVNNATELDQNSKNVISQYINDDIYGQSLDVLKLTDNQNDRVLLTKVASIFSSKLRTLPNNVRTQFLGKSAEIINQGVNDEVSLDAYIGIVVNDVKINIGDLKKVSKIYQYAKPEDLRNGNVQQFLIQLSQFCSNPNINSSIREELKKQIARYSYFLAFNGVDINIINDMVLSRCNQSFLPDIMISNHECLEYEKSENDFFPKLEEFLEMLQRGNLPNDREKEFVQLVDQATQNGIADKNVRRMLCNIITLNDITISENIDRRLLSRRFSQTMMEKILKGPIDNDFESYESLISDYISITPVGRVGNPFFPHSFFEAPYI